MLMVAIVQEQWERALLYNSKTDSPKCIYNTEPYAKTTNL